MYMIEDIGIPFEMHVDGAKEENLGRWEEVRKACLIVKPHKVIPHVVAVATGHRNWISLEMQIVIAK